MNYLIKLIIRIDIFIVLVVCYYFVGLPLWIIMTFRYKQTKETTEVINFMLYWCIFGKSKIYRDHEKKHKSKKSLNESNYSR